MIRTVIAEGGSDPNSQAAVAAVIRNRLAAGGFGDTPQAIVRAPKQFEVWSDGSAQRINPNSPQYQAAGQIVDQIAAGGPDVTNGATHFYSPSGQQARAGDGRQQTPSWAKNQTAAIGGNLFFAPNGPVQNAPAQQAISSATSPAPQPKAQPMASANIDDQLLNWGAVPKAAAATPATSVDDQLLNWGTPKAAQGSTPAVQAPAAATVAKAAAQADPNAPAAAGDASAAVGRGLANGVPIAGPAILSGLNHAVAAARALKEGVPYSQALDEVNAFSQGTADANPTATTLGQIGGAALGMAPAIAAAPGAFGVAGGSMLARMAAGGATNALIGGADAGLRGDNVGAGAGFGALGGAAGPLAGKLAGAGVNKLAGYLQGVLPTGIPGIGRSAANLMNTAINADDPAVVQQFLERHGDQAMLADAGPSMTGLASALALKPSAEKSVITNALMQRAAGSNDRIGSQIVKSIGPAVDPEAVSADIAAQRATEGKVYDTVHANAPPVDVGGVVGMIDDKLQTAAGSQRTALQRIRAELVDKPSVTNSDGSVTPETYQTSSELLHNVRKEIDSVVNYGNPGLGVEKGAVATNQGNLKTVRGALDEALKTQVRGMADADAASASLAAQQQAVQDGTKAVLGRNVPFPDTFAATRAANDPAVNAAMDQGIAGSVGRAFGTGTQRSAVTLNKLLAGGEDGFGAQNLATAFGDKKTNALLDTLAREQAFNNTTNEVVQNSATARRTAANKLLEATQPGGLNLMNASLPGMAAQGAKSILLDPLIHLIMESPNAPRNLEMARMMTAQGATRDQIFAQLQKLNGAQKTVGALGNALQRAVMGGTNRLMLAGSATNR